MRSKNKYLGIDPAIINQVKFLAVHFKDNKNLADYEVEDIEQELMCRLLPNLKKYNPQKASMATFVNRVLQRQGSNLIRKEEALKDGHRRYRLFLKKKLVAILPPFVEISKQEMGIDIDRHFKQLSPTLQDLCEMLTINNVTDIAKMSSKSRTSIYREINLIRKKFSPLFSYIKAGRKRTSRE